MRHLGMLLALCVFASAAGAQTLPPDYSFWVSWPHASGYLTNTGSTTAMVDVHTIQIDDAARLRVIFESISIGPNDKIVVRSPLTGMIHELTVGVALESDLKAYLTEMSPAMLAQHLIGGLAMSEIPDIDGEVETGGKGLHAPDAVTGEGRRPSAAAISRAARRSRP